MSSCWHAFVFASEILSNVVVWTALSTKRTTHLLPKVSLSSLKGREKSATGTKNDSEDTARFSFLTDEDCDKLKECYNRPLNTNKSRKWALANFDEWKEVRAKVIKGFERSGQQNSTKSPTQKQKHPLKGSDSQPDRESLTNTAIHCSFPAKIVIAQLVAECIIVIQWRFPVYGIYTHSPSGLVRVYSIHRKSPLYNYYIHTSGDTKRTRSSGSVAGF